MKKYFLYVSLIVLLAAGCKKESVPTASPDAIDPFTRIDNPNNAADHQIYLFYKQTGIPVLYSDTVSKNPLLLLSLSYHLTNLDSLVTVKYLTNQADIVDGVNFVKNQVIPYLGSSLKPYSILLTDSVYTYQLNYPTNTLVPLSAYLGYKTVAISYVSAIKTMSPTQLSKYRNDILKAILTVNINQNAALTQSFYAVSAAYYNLTAYGRVFSSGLIPFKPKETYGFITDGTEMPTYYNTPSQASDLDKYLDVALSLSAADFQAKYGSYPLVVQKYNYILIILKALNFTKPN